MMEFIELSSDESNQSSSHAIPVFNFIDDFMKISDEITEYRKTNNVDLTQKSDTFDIGLIKKRKIEEIDIIKLISSNDDTDDELLPTFPLETSLPRTVIENQNNFNKAGSTLSSKSSSGVFSQSDNEDDRLAIEFDLPRITKSSASLSKKKKSRTNTQTLSSKSSSGVFSQSENEEDGLPINFDEPTIESNTLLPKKKKSRTNAAISKENKANEKALKQALNEENKRLRPNECLKHMFVEIGPSILNRPYANKILEVIHSYGIKHISDPPIFSSTAVGWKRQLPRCLENNEDGKIQLSSEMMHEPFLLLIVDMEELEKLLITKTLNSQINFLKESSKCQVTLVLYGSKAYFKLKANKHNAKLKNKVRAKISNNAKEIEDHQGILTENDVEYYLTKLLFEEFVNCKKAETPEDLAYAIYQFTKAIAESPYKKAKKEVDEQADFYMRGENKKCVVIDKQGNGLLNYWCQTLTKFPLASLETSQAICEKFPSPALLLEVINGNSKDDVIKLLSDIGIRRGNGPLTTTRKLGPELAKKIYTFFTSTDGNELLT